MGGVFAFLMIMGRLLFVPLWIVALLAWRGYNHEPITWLLVWVPAMAVISALIDTTLFSRGRESDGVAWELGGFLFIAFLKLLMFTPIAAICFFGARLLG